MDQKLLDNQFKYSPFIETRVKGPDAEKFLSANLTNSLKGFDRGRIKHAIMVSEEGYLMADGLLLHTGEHEYETTCLQSYIAYRASLQDYDEEVVNTTGDTFFFQLGGPRSLDIVEAAAKESFRDLGFLRFRMARIDGMEVRIQRIGMAGSLAYEVHGAFVDSVPVYEALIAAGAPFGLKKLGRHAYWNTHTENGFPQAIIHFPYAMETDKGYYDYSSKNDPGLIMFSASNAPLRGSLGDDPEERFVNPIELGWGKAVSFDHEFIGKEALARIAAGNPRRMVSLVWNVDDIMAIKRSEFEPGEPYAKLEGPEDYNEAGTYEYIADKVTIDGKTIGTSTGRIHSWYYRQMISLGLLEPEYCEIGRDVKIVWGDPGSRQKEIRATVSRYPYMDENRNETLDLSR